MTDSNLDFLVESGEIISYYYEEIGNKEVLVIEFNNKVKLQIKSDTFNYGEDSQLLIDDVSE